MKNPGVFAVSRGIWDHGMFAPEPFTEREGWMWMVGAAAWKPIRVRVASYVVDLKRSELCFSIRFLAEKFGWSKSRVHRFIERLEADGMICNYSKIGTAAGQQSGHHPTHLSICNYNKYAFDGERHRDADESEIGTAAGQQRDKEEEPKNYKKGTSGENQKEDFRDSTIESPSLPSKYAFEGEIIKLNKRHLDLWSKNNQHIDVPSLLLGRDAWLASSKATESDRENWFSSTPQYLANKNQQAKQAQQPKAVAWKTKIEGVL